MIFYGVCIGSEDKYFQFARLGLKQLGALSRTIESRDNPSIFIAYNRILQQVRRLRDVTGLVLLHEDLEIRDLNFEKKLLHVLKDPSVAIAGPIGGRGPRGAQWWDARELHGRMPDPFYRNDFGGGQHDVDILDGCLLALNRWALETLEFDEERFNGFHIYDADICMQAKAANRRVVTFEFEAFHHTKGGYGDASSHARQEAEFLRKWDVPAPPRVWSHRLRRRLPSLGRMKRSLLSKR
jgi:hypothetical protein